MFLGLDHEGLVEFGHMEFAGRLVTGKLGVPLIK